MKLAQCEEHGPSPYCLICKHLRERNALGYFAIQAEPTEPAQAWCEGCDSVLAQERGWNDRADEQADWKLFCTACYERRLSSHRLVSWVEGTSPEEE
jgi:hypothetical protein